MAEIWSWGDALARWLHVIAGIAWIGSSFYFIHLDASLRRRDHLPEGVGGEAWQVHGGGFYRMQKYLIAPPELPAELTWFKWEAYTTWLSGMLLLAIVYWHGAELYLIDRRVLDLPLWAAIALSAGSLAAGWLVYDALCKSPLGRQDAALAAVGGLLIVAAAWGYTQIFSARAAFLHTGALIGTLMVANVAHIIMPNQRRAVADLRAGREPPPALGLAAKQRSLHNNYLTLPVVFLMLSSHVPLAYASRWNWPIVALLLVAGGVIRHFYNERHAGRASPWWCWAAAAACIAAMVLLGGSSRQAPPEATAPAPAADFAAIEEIILSRCSMCHAAAPLWPGLATAPKGVLLETPEQIRAQAAAIELQTVLSDAMPPGNLSEITPEERRILAAWLAAGR